jgi:hypothetical protein
MKKLIFVFIQLLCIGNSFAQSSANTVTPLGVESQLINNTPKKTAAAKPPMGWNSFDNFGLDITEDEFKQQVDYIAVHLKQYEYITIDAGWYAPCLNNVKKRNCYIRDLVKYSTFTDSFGRWIPAPNKFSSAQNGNFKSLANYVHSKGLKFGLHIQRGIPWDAVDKNKPIYGTKYHAKDIANTADMCPWWDATVGVDMSKPGAQEYYNSCYRQYADWGVDFVKVDDMSNPYHADEIVGVRKAIEASGRNMVYSLSPGSTPITARWHVINNADMWRISDDFWDTWPQLKNQFKHADEWMQYQTEGHWADLDMLPIGIVGTKSDNAGNGSRRSRFTEDELHTMMTLWCMFKSPLILGGDVTRLTDFETQIITNKVLLDIDQNSKGRKLIPNQENSDYIMSCESKDSKTLYIAFFNLGDTSKIISTEMSRFKLPVNYTITDVWNTKLINATDKLTAKVNAHGAMLFMIKEK